MNQARYSFRGLFALLLLFPCIALAGTDALLAKVQKAGQNLSYAGVFVYQRDDQLDSFRIVHKASGGRVRERLISLNGAPREIIRRDREIHCYFQGEDTVLIEHRRMDGRTFPSLLPDSLANLKENYKFRRGKDGRVAGRKAHVVLIKPRDDKRYGYELWADATSGLLLKAALIDQGGGVIEKYMFTDIAVDQPISDADLSPQSSSSRMKQPRAESMDSQSGSEGWVAADMPSGFGLTARMTRAKTDKLPPMEHLVYSDGLATVSVFIEPESPDSPQQSLDGISQMGAIHVMGRVVDGHQITIVGEVPAPTIAIIGNSIRRQP